MSRTVITVAPDLRAFSSLKYQENQRKAARNRAADTTDCCVVCGRMANSEFVVLSDGGEYITPEEYRDTDLGYYPVGPDCARKLRKEGVPTFKKPVPCLG